MRNKEVATWVWGKRTWEGRERSFGTILVLADSGLHDVPDSGLIIIKYFNMCRQTATRFPRGDLFKSLHSGLIKPLHSDLSELPRSSLLYPPLSGLIIKPDSDNMANENVPAPAPTRSDDQILPFSAWVLIGKSNYEAKTRVCSFQLDEDWFILDANFLREALEITPIIRAHQFESPPTGNAIMDFVNELGYPEELHFVSRMAVNKLYQPWRAILSMIDQCLTGKISGYDRPRYPTFLTDKANRGITTKKDKKIKPHVILYCRFTKLIVGHLERKNNIHQRYVSLFNMAEDDHRLRNLKFVPKGKEDEVFGMKIPKELITENIRNAPYYNAYLEMVAKHDHKIVAEEGGKKKSASKMILESFQPPVDRVTFREPTTCITQKLLIIEGKGKSIASDEQVAQSLLELQTSKKTSTTDQYIFHRWILVTEEASTGPSTQPEDDTSTYIVRDTPSPTDAKTCAETDKTNSEGDTEILNIGEEQVEDVEDNVDLEEKSVEVDEGQAGSDPDLDLASRVSALEQLCANLEKRHKLHDKTIQDLSKAVMKEILHGQMFKSGSYISQHEHVALYEALEASMKHDNRDEFLVEKDKSYKRRRDDQDHPPPPIKESEQGKKKKQDYDASDRLETPEPDWTVPSTDLPEPENNWANAFATSYKDLKGNKLLQKTSDMSSSIKWMPLIFPSKKITPLSPSQRPRSIEIKNQKKIMQETRVHKFSDGMLTRILEKLDHMVKDFKLSKYNSGKEKRIWSGDDIRRSKEFMEVIERRLKIRRIFRSLGSFNIRVIPKSHSEDGNPARANIKQALGR
nr:hypothetical protein [Tanacetum cinerariifolium]